MQNAWIRARYHTTNDFSAAGISAMGAGSVTVTPVRLAESTGGAARRANIAVVTPFLELVADERPERILEVGLGPDPPGQLLRRPDRAHGALVDQGDSIAQRLGLFH